MELVSVALTLALLIGPAPESRAMTSEPMAPRISPTAPIAPDEWLGEDKLRHFLMSFAVTTYAYAGARTVADHEAAAAVALAAGAGAGVGKELYDRAAGRPFSLRDLAADGLGMLAAWVLIRNTR